MDKASVLIDHKIHPRVKVILVSNNSLAHIYLKRERSIFAMVKFHMIWLFAIFSKSWCHNTIACAQLGSTSMHPNITHSLTRFGPLYIFLKNDFNFRVIVNKFWVFLNLTLALTWDVFIHILTHLRWTHAKI